MRLHINVHYNIHFLECRFTFWSRADKEENSASTFKFDIQRTVHRDVFL